MSSPSAAAAYALRRSSVGMARTRSSHSSAVVMARPCSARSGTRYLPAVERQVAAAGPRVEELQREERVAAALLDGALHRVVVERQRRAQERLGVVGRERLELEHPAVPLGAHRLHAERGVEVGRERLAARGHRR